MINDFDLLQKKDKEEGKFSVGDIVFYWHRGYDPNRKVNEDDWGVAKTPNGYLFVVCDGMGGHVGGQEASRIAVETILSFLNKDYPDNPVENILQNAIITANTAVFETAQENPALKGMGTTACVLLVPLPGKGNTVHFAHVGDSRIYIFAKSDNHRDKERHLYRLTKDHSFVQTLVDLWEKGDHEKGIPDWDAEKHEKKNIIMRALGIKAEVQPTLGKAKPVNGDIFLICSDGLTGMVSDADITATLDRTDISLQEKGEELKDKALNNGGSDNITLQLIQISESFNSKSLFNDFNPKSQQCSQDYRKTEQSNYARQKPKKTFLSPGVIAVLVIAFILALIIGGVSLYNTNSKKKQIKQLIENRNEAEKSYKSLQTKFDEESRTYKETQRKTQEDKKKLDKNSTNKEVQQWYSVQYKLDSIQKHELDSLNQALVQAKRKWENLRDSSDIVSK